MKKRIIAAALTAVLLLNVVGSFTRVKATGAVIAGGAAIGILAFNLIGVMTGRYDDCAEGISCFIDNGVEGWQKAFVGSADTPSWFVSGWEQIYNTCSSWFNTGAITIDDSGKVRMKYSQYLELCGLIGEAYAEFDINLSSDIPYICFKADRDVLYQINSAIMVCSVDDLADGMSYAPVFYTDDKLYLPDSSFFIRLTPWSDTDSNAYASCFISRIEFINSISQGSQTVLGGYYGSCHYSEFISRANMSFGGNTTDLFVSYKNFAWSDDQLNLNQSVNWYCYDGSTLTAAAPDLTNTPMAILNCRGNYLDFVKSITSYSAVSVPADVDDLSDPLATVLEKTKDPTLEIDTDPSIVTPADAVNITDIPGESDVPLSQLQMKTRVDIDIPSVIADKFPFCIPFDFIRIISVLCADPKAPVFRIPISTDPKNLEPFEGNQTIGDVPEDFEPLFEIDDEIVIDLSCIPLVQPICYTVFIIGFVVLLIMITPKLINH